MINLRSDIHIGDVGLIFTPLGDIQRCIVIDVSGDKSQVTTQDAHHCRDASTLINFCTPNSEGVIRVFAHTKHGLYHIEGDGQPPLDFILAGTDDIAVPRHVMIELLRRATTSNG